MRDNNSFASCLRHLAAILILGLGAAACSDSGVGVESRTSLALTVNAAQVSATSGRIQIEGPENRTVSISPGGTEEIDLEPGSYTVALEGLSGGTVVGYWERRATVTEGRQTELTVNPEPFQPSSAPSATTQAFSGEPFVVSWSSVGGAESYDLQASTSPSFSNVGDELRVDGTSAEVTVTGSATVYFRVRARTRFNGVGNFGPASSGTEIRIPVTSVVVTPQDAELEVGETLTYQAATRGPGGQELTGRSVTWASTNPGVATVDAATGQVTAVAGGTTTIEATSEGATGTSVLTVVETPTSVTIAPESAVIPLGGTAQLTATVRSASGAALSGFDVDWRSDAPGVASVNSSGVVTGVAGGSTIVRATVVGFPSVEGEAIVTVGAGSPPRVELFEVDFLPLTEDCLFRSGDFRTIERLAYADVDGDMDPTRPFEDPAAGAPAENVEVQFRAQDLTDWFDFNDRKRYTPNANASGSSGQLDGNDPTCFGGGDENLEYIDFRVRVRDASGNWSDWFETRKFMPQQVVVAPPGAAGGMVSLTPCTASLDFDFAYVVDFNGNSIPEAQSMVTWVNYATPGLATMSTDGVYTLSGTAGGADHVWGRAAYARDRAPLVVGGLGGADEWISPGWSFQEILPSTSTRSYRTQVFEGREYTFRLLAGAATAGDADIYIRFGARPTFSTFDASSTNAGFADEIVYTAPADGVVWILVNVVVPPNGNAIVSVVGDRLPPSGYEVLPPIVGLPGRPGAEAQSAGVQDLGLTRRNREVREAASAQLPVLVDPTRSGGGH